MKSFIMRVAFFTILLFLFVISSAYPAAEKRRVEKPKSMFQSGEHRIALVIGNSAYSSGPLKNPVNDAADMAAILKKLGFSVTLKQNAKLQDMDEAIEAFGNSLKRGGVGLFYYAGHGVQVNGINYLLPIGAKINKETDVKYQAVDANKILDEMATANNGLNIVMLDACRDNPFARRFRNATNGLAIVSSAPSGTFISYSTSPGNVARDGDGRNSPYTKALLENITKPGLSINDVFMNVRLKVKKETGQIPWELSSLEGHFYFNPQGSRQNNLSSAHSYAPQPESNELARQKETLEREKQELQRQKALDAEREQLAAERRKVEAEIQKLVTLKREQLKSSPIASPKKDAATGLRPQQRLGGEQKSQGSENSEVAAIINGEKIYMGAVDQKLDIYIKMSGKNDQTDFSSPEGKKTLTNMKKQILNVLIQEKILATEAVNEKITVFPQEIKDKINAIKKTMNLADKDFDAFLEKHDMSLSNFEKGVKNEILISKLIAKGTDKYGFTKEVWIEKLNARAKVEINYTINPE